MDLISALNVSQPVDENLAFNDALLASVFKFVNYTHKVFQITANKDFDGKITGYTLYAQHLVENDNICCPYCNSNQFKKKGKHPTKYRHILIGNLPTQIARYSHRFQCKHCSKKFTVVPDFAHGNSRITKELNQSIIETHNELGTFVEKSTSKAVGVSQYYVRKSLQDYYDQEFRDGGNTATSTNDCSFKLPPHFINKVMVDEVSMKGRHYLTLFFDPETMHLLFWVEKNNKAAIQAFVKWAGISLSPNLQIVCDMNAPFLSAFKELLPDCIVTFDRFHHMANIVEDLTTAYYQLADTLPENCPVKQLFFAKERPALNLLFVRANKLTNEDRKELKHIFQACKHMETLYDFYIGMIDLYDQAKVYQNTHAFEIQAIALCGKLLSLELDSPVFSVYKKKKTLFERCGLSMRFLTCFNTEQLPIQLDSDDEDTNTTSKNAKRAKRFSVISRIVRRVLNKLPHIANFAITNLTTGPIEGCNNKFKVLKRARYGIKIISRFMDGFRLSCLVDYVPNTKTKWP